MNKTHLYNKHINLNAKVIPFAGYYMPVSYGKINIEYDAVRYNCGIFDVSHMGQIKIEGDDAESFLQYLTINNVEKISDYEAQYSAMCNEDGNLIDDLIIFKLSKKNILLLLMHQIKSK